jgi:ribosome maturation factor RimP
MFALLRAIFVSMDLKKEKIINIVTETVKNNGFFLIELIIRGLEKNRIIEVYIDGEKDISADDCALVSREINLQLENLTESSYRLDVSSPGVDRPLKYLKQYPKHLNRNFDISYTQNDETKKLSGKFLAMEGDELTFLINNQIEKKVNFNNIKKAKVIVSFS